jgi:hypothetical protein
MGTYPFSAIDHVQLAMPPEGEGLARVFYGTLLGMTEVPKPAELAKRGGCWFECGPVQIHLGVEADFRPARKAHPALRCFDYDGLADSKRVGLRLRTMPAFLGCGDVTLQIRLATGLN